MKTKAVLTVVMVLLVTSVCVADWPQYLGPDRNGVSKETGLLRSWPEAGPKVLWTVPLGAGYGGAAISKNNVYVLDRVGDEKDVLRCLDLSTGKEQWSYQYDAAGRVQHPGSRSTPAIDRDYVYTCGSFGDVYCFDTNTHQPVWNKNIWKDYEKGSGPRWAVSQNPLIYGDLLILASQTSKAGVVAYDKLSGQVKWTSPALAGRVGYVSPSIVKIAGGDQLVMITAGARGGASGVVVGMDPKTGKTLWSYEGWNCQIPVPNVTEIGDGRLFITGGYQAGSVMIKIEQAGDSFAATEVYKTQAFGTHVHPAILHKSHLYGQCTTNETRDGLVCMDLDGKVKWKTGNSPLFDKGGAILADGLILTLDGREGILYLIEPDPAGFKPLAKAKLLSAPECWGPLALSDGKLLIRDQKQMKCVEVR